MEERLQKVLARRGIASRRGAEQLIRDGRVTVNGQRANLGIKVDAARDTIEVDRQRLEPDAAKPIYILLNKPGGVVSTCRDPQKRTTVLDILPDELARDTGLHPVGRLDANSTGALLLTNDGDLTFRLSHPRHHVAKTYRVWVRGIPTEASLQQWRSGVMLDDRRTLPATVELLGSRRSRDRRVDREAELEIVLTEGRNRQIRRVAELLGHPVLALHRLSIGALSLAPTGKRALRSGEYRHLSPSELADL
ncbi:MAG: pseudouridine synthase [Geitlerinemataceae cyanobacterium]